jgi:hypothetical protein
MELEQKLNAAARLLKCQVGEFMAYAERANGDLVVIARDGKKFVYSVERLGAVNLAEPKLEPKGKPAAQPARRTVPKRAAIKSAAIKLAPTSRSKPQ